MSALESALRFALSLPNAFEDHPWGETVVKVAVGSKPKIFVFLGFGGTTGVPSMSVKLPHSCLIALQRHDAEPTGYGLGKSGWVSFQFQTFPPEAQLNAWIQESYDAVAPKPRRRK